MYNVNLAVVSLFGYTKSEIINRNVKLLMPNLYQVHHDSFIENYVSNKDSKLFNKERMVFAKNKAGYAFPIFLMIKPIHSLIHGIQLFGNIRPEQSIKLCGYILCNLAGIIETITSCLFSITFFFYFFCIF